MKRKASTSQGQLSKKSKPAAYKRQNAALMLGQELKFHDSAITSAANTTTAVVALSSMAAGDTAILRDGNRIMTKSLEVKLRLALDAITQNAVCRFVIVHDKNANASAITWSGALGVFDAATPESQRNISTLSRYTILMDKIVVLNQGSGTGGAVQKGFIKKYVKINDDLQLASYLDSTASIPVSGSLALIYLSDVAAGATDVAVTGTCRLRFVG